MRRINVNGIVGNTYGKLKVLWWDHYDGEKHYYKVLCSCGKLNIVRRNNLINGNTTSCHCYHADTDDELRDIIMRIPQNRNGCRIFPGAKNATGYGRIGFKGKLIRIHMESARLFIGDRPEGLVTMHSCATPPCCEPSHLSYGTHSQNLQDAYDKEGHPKPYTKMNLDKARQVRAIYPRMTYKELARRFNCSEQHIGNIVNNKRWPEPDIACPKDNIWMSEGHEQMSFNF